MLFTESILSERHPDSGTRISVMSRHTLNDGVTPDPRIIPASYDEHISQMAPGHVERAEDIVSEGQEVKVRVTDVSPEGKVGLSMLFGTDIKPESEGRPSGGGGFRPRSSSFGDRPRSSSSGGYRSSSRSGFGERRSPGGFGRSSSGGFGGSRGGRSSGGSRGGRGGFDR